MHTLRRALRLAETHKDARLRLILTMFVMLAFAVACRADASSPARAREASPLGLSGVAKPASDAAPRPLLSHFARTDNVSCAAAPVHHEANASLGSFSGGRWVETTPRSAGLIGYLWGGREVEGRFAVYATGVNPKTHHNEKVMWLAPSDEPETAKLLARLQITGRRLGVAHKQTFTHRFGGSYSADMPGEQLFPSILRPPTAGCWKLTLQTGSLTSSIVVRALPTRVASMRAGRS